MSNSRWRNWIYVGWIVPLKNACRCTTKNLFKFDSADIVLGSLISPGIQTDPEMKLGAL